MLQICLKHFLEKTEQASLRKNKRWRTCWRRCRRANGSWCARRRSSSRSSSNRYWIKIRGRFKMNTVMTSPNRRSTGFYSPRLVRGIFYLLEISHIKLKNKGSYDSNLKNDEFRGKTPMLITCNRLRPLHMATLLTPSRSRCPFLNNPPTTLEWLLIG